MLLREKVLYPETVSDLKAALADCPDDMDIYDALGETLCCTLETFDDIQVITIK